MSSGENKQRSVYVHINHLKSQAYELLSKYHLFKEDNTLVIQGSVITSANGESLFTRTNEIFKYYNKNSSCFVFKLIDESIFGIYVLVDEEGLILKSSFSFCSCPILKDILIDEQGNYTIEELEELDDDEPKESLLDNELKCFFNDKCEKDGKLIRSLIDLAKNPLYIRCDYDRTCVSETHPEYHLTINFIKDSRFKIDSEFSFFDFVVFILDIVYGKKPDSPSQYIHLSQS